MFATNDASQAVPVTGAVDVESSPTVTSLQGGSWTVSPNGTPVVGIDPSGNTLKLDSSGDTITAGNSPTVKLDPSANRVQIDNSPAVKLDPNSTPIPEPTSVQTRKLFDTGDTNPGSITVRSVHTHLTNIPLNVSKYETFRVYVDGCPDSNSDVKLYLSVPVGGRFAQVGTLHVFPDGSASAELDVRGTQIPLDIVPDGDAPGYIDVAVYGR